jgi:hypothetical protein
VFKAPGATLAPPSFQSHLAQPTDDLDRICLLVKTDLRKIGPRVLYFVMLLFFPRGNAATLTLLSEELNCSHGEKRESSRAAPVYASARLHAPKSLVGFAYSSPVALIRRLICSWTIFPATCQTRILCSTYENASHRQLAYSGTPL